MLGFELDFWDYATFGALMMIGAGFITLLWLMLSWPGRIAIARQHPEAEAVNMMGWLGFVAVVPWVQAFIWAFKPTDVVDLRYGPRRVARETAVQIARLTGRPLSEAAAPPAPALEPPPKAHGE
jgi:Protein of unknown function (DUF3302)